MISKMLSCGKAIGITTQSGINLIPNSYKLSLFNKLNEPRITTRTFDRFTAYSIGDNSTDTVTAIQQNTNSLQSSTQYTFSVWIIPASAGSGNFAFISFAGSWSGGWTDNFGFGIIINPTTKVFSTQTSYIFGGSVGGSHSVLGSVVSLTDCMLGTVPALRLVATFTTPSTSASALSLTISPASRLDETTNVDNNASVVTHLTDPGYDPVFFNPQLEPGTVASTYPIIT